MYDWTVETEVSSKRARRTNVMSRLSAIVSCISLLCAFGANGSETPPTPISPSEARIDLGSLMAQSRGVPARVTSCPTKSTQQVRRTPECGFNAEGEPRPGLFQCTLRTEARSTGCEEQCRLMECRSP